MQITITDLAKPDNPICQLVRDAEHYGGILPIFKHVSKGIYAQMVIDYLAFNILPPN